jgi:CubicO group peptidase (beta-lactamase class C family)
MTEAPRSTPRRLLLRQGAALAGALALAPLSRTARADAPADTAAKLLPALDALLARSVAADGPGLAVLVARGPTLLARRARGMASIELGVPLAPEHVQRIGSVTKQYAAAALLQLVDQGRARLDDPLAKFLPAYPNGAAIRLAQLLNHTSGVKSYTGIPGYMHGPVRRDLSTAELIAEFSALPVDFAPGAGWAYNNSGYVLVGAVIEAITQQPWHAQVAAMLQPLGLKRTVYEDPQRVIPGLATGYGERRPAEGGGPRRAGLVSMTQPHAAGALLSTVDELWQWNLALHGGRVLRPETYARMSTPEGAAQKDGYGFGLRRETLHGQPALLHGGGIHGFKSVLIWLPGPALTVAVLHNADGPAVHVGRLGAEIAGLALAAG